MNIFQMKHFIIMSITRLSFLYINKMYILIFVELYITLIVQCIPIQELYKLSNKHAISTVLNTTHIQSNNNNNNNHNDNSLKLNSGYSELWKETTTIPPVIGRVIWCVNESKQNWRHIDNPMHHHTDMNISSTISGNMNILRNKKLILLNSGKFICPQPNQSEDMKYCCGPLGKQTCCKITDTPGLRWGIPLGVIVTIIVFLTVSYTIQVFRACDRCYHECPIFTPVPNDAEFQWDTRWYTVSHEGNRYGVTFHSRLFANEFMKCLEAEYGRWNTANILKIQRDGQNFVILNIFFHDLFTPWFYTQGPIKNDEEWIRTDFKNICHTVQARLAVNPRFKWKLNKFSNTSKNYTSQKQTHPLQSTNTTSQSEDGKSTQHQHQMNTTTTTTTSTTATPWIPWTKVAYIPSLTETSVRKHLTRGMTKSKYKSKSENKSSQLVNVIILEDIIECNGLDKGVQTHQKRLQTHKANIDPVV
ncbi:unnamed protein product [Trichobilharzia szidati]|nr:unnamed protein product [Trichobilharzia szidati]